MRCLLTVTIIACATFTGCTDTPNAPTAEVPTAQHAAPLKSSEPLASAPVAQAQKVGIANQAPIDLATATQSAGPAAGDVAELLGTDRIAGAGCELGCDDANVCTTDKCVGGVCVHNISNCSDGNVCTVDDCHPVLGCSIAPADGDCNDGSVCTVSDTCTAGQCQGAALPCDDGDSCTADSCHALAGCQHVVMVGAPCEDGDLCSAGDTCGTGGCQAGPAMACETCGDGTKDVPVLPVCPNVESVTAVTDLAQLTAWKADPTTSLSIEGDVVVDDSGFHLATACGVTVTAEGSLTGATNLKIVAHDVTVAGAVEASQRIELLASGRVSITESADVSGANDVVMEANEVVLHGQVAVADYLCAEADVVTVVSNNVDTGSGDLNLSAFEQLTVGLGIQTSGAVSFHSADALAVTSNTNVKGAQGVEMSGQSVTMAGRVTQVSDVTIMSSSSLIIEAAARIEGAKAFLASADGQLVLAGRVSDIEEAQISAHGLTVTASGVVSDAETVSVNVLGPQPGQWQGTLEGSGNVVVDAGSLNVGASAHMRQNKNLVISVKARLDIDGQLSTNQALSLHTAEYWLGPKHSLFGNGSCSIFGQPAPDSAIPLGCQ